MAGMRVRMYRQGLGDCLLLTFDPGGSARHVLIDCGTLGSSELVIGGKKSKVAMKDVVADIVKSTGGHLHLVIATHEHEDHLSGFASQAKQFKDAQGRAVVKVDEVWTAWTENPADPDAVALKKYARDLGLALGAALGAAGSDSDLGKHLGGLLGFAGAVAPGVRAASDAGPSSLGAKFAPTVDAAMHLVRTGLGPEAQYREPGEVLQPDWLPGFRVYVLGPPRSRERLGSLGDHGSGELYNLRLAALDGLAPDLQNSIDGEVPFDSRFRVPCRHSDAVKAEAQQMYPEYFSKECVWRRIDQAWLEPAHHLALQLDSLTNNTSLALAFERISDGKVLLFPADAQQGAWESWHEVEFTVDGKAVTAKDLLRRTVFYKVGHHGSHNATAKGKGLELMEGENLTAFIPVDRRVALNKGTSGWNMPARALYKRLLEKCDGRVARSDLGLVDDAANAADKATERELRGVGSAADWARWRAAQKLKPRIDDSNRLYVEYFLE